MIDKKPMQTYDGLLGAGIKGTDILDQHWTRSIRVYEKCLHFVRIVLAGTDMEIAQLRCPGHAELFHFLNQFSPVPAGETPPKGSLNTADAYNLWSRRSKLVIPEADRSILLSFPGNSPEDKESPLYWIDRYPEYKTLADAGKITKADVAKFSFELKRYKDADPDEEVASAAKEEYSKIARGIISGLGNDGKKADRDTKGHWIGRIIEQLELARTTPFPDANVGEYLCRTLGFKDIDSLEDAASGGVRRASPSYLQPSFLAKTHAEIVFVKPSVRPRKTEKPPKLPVDALIEAAKKKLEANGLAWSEAFRQLFRQMVEYQGETNYYSEILCQAMSHQSSTVSLQCNQIKAKALLVKKIDGYKGNTEVVKAAELVQKWCEEQTAERGMPYRLYSSQFTQIEKYRKNREELNSPQEAREATINEVDERGLDWQVLDYFVNCQYSEKVLRYAAEYHDACRRLATIRLPQRGGYDPENPDNFRLNWGDSKPSARLVYHKVTHLPSGRSFLEPTHIAIQLDDKTGYFAYSFDSKRYRREVGRIFLGDVDGEVTFRNSVVMQWDETPHTTVAEPTHGIYNSSLAPKVENSRSRVAPMRLASLPKYLLDHQDQYEIDSEARYSEPIAVAIRPNGRWNRSGMRRYYATINIRHLPDDIDQSMQAGLDINYSGLNIGVVDTNNNIVTNVSWVRHMEKGIDVLSDKGCQIDKLNGTTSFWGFIDRLKALDESHREDGDQWVFGEGITNGTYLSSACLQIISAFRRLLKRTADDDVYNMIEEFIGFMMNPCPSLFLADPKPHPSPFGAISSNRIVVLSRCIDIARSVYVRKNGGSIEGLESDPVHSWLRKKVANVRKDRDQKLRHNIVTTLRVHKVGRLIPEQLSFDKTKMKGASVGRDVRINLRRLALLAPRQFQTKLEQVCKRYGIATAYVNPAMTSHTDLDGWATTRWRLVDLDKEAESAAKQAKANLGRPSGLLNDVYRSATERWIAAVEEETGLDLRKGSNWKKMPERYVLMPYRRGRYIYCRTLGKYVEADNMASVNIALKKINLANGEWFDDENAEDGKKGRKSFTPNIVPVTISPIAARQLQYGLVQGVAEGESSEIDDCLTETWWGLAKSVANPVVSTG